MTLSEALEPLWRAYLRRLDEMAARVPGEALLTEATTRDGSGALACGRDGLPLRFDVADARTGGTYEVHGTSPDAPRVAELRAGRLDVRLEAGNWEALPVVCVFDGEPLARDADALADLFGAFAALGSYGGFAGARLPWRGRLHGLAVHRRANEVWAVLDLGSCPPAAMDALASALSGWSEDRVPLARVRIGGTPPNDPS